MTIVQRTSHTGEWVGPLVGRRVQMDAVRQFLSELPSGPSHLVLEGPAGIGKSTIWAAALGAARSNGHAVLATRPAAGDASVPWAGLSDLLGTVAATTLDALPEPQRRALDIALARREPDSSPLDELSVRLATVGVLSGLSESGPVVVAVDDLQWLDAASTGVLAFALRRVGGRVGLLASYRTAGDPLGDAAEPTRDPGKDPVIEALPAVQRVEVGPLDDDPLRAIVRDHAPALAARSIINDLCRMSGGNPLYAIELARHAGETSSGARADVAAPAGLRSVVEQRFSGLPDRARELAAVIAVTGAVPWEEARALAGGSVSDGDLDAAIRAGFLASTGGLVSFSHPLLAAIVLGAISEPHRRRLHRAFADRWPDSDAASGHLAAAATGPDSGVAGALDASADRARLRGAPGAAAARYERAIELTPPDDRESIDRRRIEAALAHVAAGDMPRAREQLETVAARRDAPRRAEALSRLAGVVWAAEGDRAGMEAFERALPAAAGQPAIEGDIHDNLAWLTCWLGDMPRAYEHVQIARRRAEEVGDPALLARVFDKYGQIEFQIGRAPGIESESRAIHFESEAEGVGEAAMNMTVLLIWSDRFEEARERLAELHERISALGDERLKPEIASRLGLLEQRAGNFRLAREHLERAIAMSREAGLATGPIDRTIGYLNAAQGRTDEALALSEAGLAGARANGAAWNVIRYLGIAGSAHLARGDAHKAADALDEAATLCDHVGVGEPGLFRLGPDAVEALVAGDRLDRAEAVVETLERQSRAVGRDWGIAGAVRGRALIAAARGRYDAALAHATDALTRSEALGQPFELGRAQLAAGTIERRAGHRREARTHLAAAEAGFRALEAESWADRAASELGRISGRTPSDGSLTPTERQVAALVAEGLTNGEVAARMFVTVRTIETNLTRIYGKLGVRSRTELSRHMAANPPAETKEPVLTG